MKLKFIIESDADDIMAQIRQLRDDNANEFTKIRDTLSRAEIAKLTHMVKRKGEKKGSLVDLDPELDYKFSSYDLIDSKNRVTTKAVRFLRWVNDNPSKEMDFIDKRADANDSLTRGQLKRDNDWVPKIQRQARRIVKNLSSDEQESFRKLYNRYFNKKTKNLAGNWGDVPESDIRILRNYGLIDSDGNITELGEFSIKYYMAFKDDPDGLNRVSADQRVGNYGTARKRRQSRSKKYTDKFNK